MLTPMDDTLWHQLPTTFDHVGTSDPRFFDRYWFGCYAPDGSAAFQLTMGAYRNMNVLDAGAAAIVDGQQYNVRVSRELQRSAEPVCRELRVEPLEPLRRLRLTVAEGPQPLTAELVWTGIEEPSEEHPHFERHRGRIAQEYVRFSQIGVADGWIDIAGRRYDARNWWACRDHSWGVRRGMGVREPITGPKANLAERGHLQAFLYFSTDDLSGKVHVQYRGEDAPYTTGTITDRQTGTTQDVDHVDLGVDFHSDSRRFQATEMSVTLGDGTHLTLGAVPLGPSFAMPGLGYSGGFDDRAGPGAWRGESHHETDVWAVDHPSVVTRADGSTHEPWHRIQPVRVLATRDGHRTGGTGSLTLTATGRLPSRLHATSPA